MAALSLPRDPADPDEDLTLRLIQPDGSTGLDRVGPQQFREPKLPDLPTNYLPMTAKKISVMRSRASLKRTLFHPHDGKPKTLRNVRAEAGDVPKNGVVVPSRDFEEGEETYEAQRRLDEDEDAVEEPSEPESWEIRAAENRRRWARLKRQHRLHKGGQE